MEPGSIAEWLSALSTILATGAAGIAGYVAYRAYEREKSRDRQDLASGIHAWLAWDKDCTTGGTRIVLVNSTPSLVYRVSVDLTMSGNASTAPSRNGVWQVLPPGTFVVEPHPTYMWSFPEPIVDLHRFCPYTRSDEHLVTALEFSDARGIRWRRDRAGGLREQSATDNPGTPIGH